MTQFGVAIAAEGVVETPLKMGDLAMVVQVGGSDEPALAEFRDDSLGYCTSACDPGCCQYWAFFGTEYTCRPSEVVVVRRVRVVDEAALDSPAVTELRLSDPRDTLKMLRETLCVAQVAAGGGHRERIQRVINEIDRQRPLGSDGKHGDRHTSTCGCDLPAESVMAGTV